MTTAPLHLYAVAARPAPVTLGTLSADAAYRDAVERIMEATNIEPAPERTQETRTIAMLAIAVIEGREEAEYKARMLHWLADQVEAGA